jgi:poly(3-hydroxybutyrate) depolymerase
MTTRTAISFSSGGDTPRGWLEHPTETTEPLPLVVMAHARC